MDDPAGNSFFQGDIGEDETSLTVRHYTRTQQQDEQIGLFAAATEPNGDQEKDDQVSLSKKFKLALNFILSYEEWQ